MHKSPYTAVLTWGAGAVVLFLLFRVTSHTGLDAYFWLSPQGVIWIVLVQALTAIGRSLPAVLITYRIRNRGLTPRAAPCE